MTELVPSTMAILLRVGRARLTLGLFIIRDTSITTHQSCGAPFICIAHAAAAPAARCSSAAISIIRGRAPPPRPPESSSGDLPLGATAIQSHYALKRRPRCRRRPPARSPRSSGRNKSPGPPPRALGAEGAPRNSAVTRPTGAARLPPLSRVGRGGLGRLAAAPAYGKWEN